MMTTKTKARLSGGFHADREFGFQLSERFPDLDVSQADTEGVALVVRIDSPRRLSLRKLSKVLIGAASGGVKTAVIVMPERNLAIALPLCNVWLMVDENAELRAQLRVESAIRSAA